jgi:hypothetical protein
VGDVLLAYAKATNRNVVASLCDEAFGYGLQGALQGEGVHLQQTIDALTNSGVMKHSSVDNWEEFQPQDRLEAAVSFTPRDVLEGLMKAVINKRYLDVHDLASYAYGTGRVARSGIGEYYLMMFDRSVASGMDRTDWDALRLFGSFSGEAQKSLENGARFPFTSLNASQRNLLSRITFKSRIENERIASADSVQISGKSVEPTEAFPNGLPMSGVLSTRTATMPVLIAYAQGPGGTFRPLRTINEWTIAAYEAQVGANPQAASQYTLNGLVGYAPGSQKLVAMRLELAPNVWKEIGITVMDQDPNPKPVPWEQLPAKTVETIRGAIESQRKGGGG